MTSFGPRGARRRGLLAAPLAVAGALAAGSCAEAPPRAAPPPSVLLVTIDSLRADFVDLSPGGPTPRFAALAAEGVSFSRAYTVTPWTAPALVSIFTGLYPETHGVANRDDTTPGAVPTLPRLLAARGYGLANFGFFSEVSYYRNLGLPKPLVADPELAGASALRAWLRTAPRPFFAWIHHVEPHLPYGASGYEAATPRVPGSTGLARAQVSATVPLDASLAFDPEERETLRRLYAEDVAAADREVGATLDALAAAGLAESTLVVLTADHGEELLDAGWVGHASTSGEARLADDVLRIPLLLRGPGVPRGRSVSGLVQNVDVAPTILELLDLQRPKEMQGVSLVPAWRRGRRPRTRVFFDTAPGGHLTPDERRGERLQGVSDGRLLHTERVGAAARSGDPSAPELANDLARFRRRQAAARLKFLTAFGGAARPPAAAVERFAETLALLAPYDAARLDFQGARGTIRLAWDAAPRPREPYWVEYRVGSGLLATSGAFSVEEAAVSFGPFPLAFWNDLARYAPFRFRVVDPSASRRSAWRTFSLAPAEATATPPAP